MYLQFKDVSHAGNNNGDSNNTHDVVVLTGKEVDGNDEGNNIAVGENWIISVLQSKKKKESNSRSLAPESLTKGGTYYKVLTVNMADEIDLMLSILGPIQQWLR